MIVSTKHLMILAVMMVMTISARSAMPLGSSKNAMSYNAAKHEALFLSDKMAYELNLTAAQYEAVYEINLDYLMSLNGHGDVFGIWWLAVRQVCDPEPLLSPCGLEGRQLDVCSIYSL